MTVERSVERLEAALKEIANLDYRGYPHESALIAIRALEEVPPVEVESTTSPS